MGATEVLVIAAPWGIALFATCLWVAYTATRDREWWFAVIGFCAAWFVGGLLYLLIRGLTL